jgi:CRP-like cAMP-binding protein
MFAVVSEAQPAAIVSLLRRGGPAHSDIVVTAAPAPGQEPGGRFGLTPQTFAPPRFSHQSLPFHEIAQTVIDYERDAEIVAQGGAAEHCWQVISGCVRTVKLLEDGRRHVGAFLLPGDVFGWETLGEHEFAAEAVTAVKLRRMRASALEDHADHDRGFARLLRQFAQAQVRATQARLVLLGRKTAAERIACFLGEMRVRLGGAGCCVIELPMSRSDMADYLGLTIETVCRGLSDLKRLGTIAVDRTRIAIQDPQALDRAASDPIH